MDPFGDCATVGSSYRSPRVSVKFLEALHLSEIKNASRHCRAWTSPPMPAEVTFRGNPSRKSAAAFPEIPPVKLNRPREAFCPWLPVVKR